MPRVIFVGDYIYTPTLERRVSTKFKASPKPRLVNQDCADKALAAGVARLAEGASGSGAPARRPSPKTKTAASGSGAPVRRRSRRAKP